MTQGGWLIDSEIDEAVLELSAQCLAAYEVNPSLVEEHFGIERGIAEGGYGRRQIYELVQNGADAMLGTSGQRIEVVLSNDYLYCANEGEPINRDGVKTILASHRSAKRGNEIGRFGVGFKSVLAVTDAPEFYSRSGSFRFEPERSAGRIAKVAEAEADRMPRLRLAFPVDPAAAAQTDAVLADLMEWAATVVRLPLNSVANRWLAEDLRSFPPEFVLFSSHVKQLGFRDASTGFRRRISSKSCKGGVVELDVDGNISPWQVIASTYKLTDEAKESAGELADRDELPLVWAVPVGDATTRGAFWAFFPTEFWTTLRGIINAPWKITPDRQNLLKSAFNVELIQRAAELVVRSLKLLSTIEDPAKHLDYLPGRGRESPQWADEEITKDIYYFTRYEPSLPNLDGVLKLASALRLAPVGIPESASQIHAANCADRSWVHPSINSRQRRPRAERIFGSTEAESLATWLGDLVLEPTEAASRLAIQVAAELVDAEDGSWREVPIVLTSDGDLSALDPDRLFLGGAGSVATTGVRLVAPELAQDPDVRATLEKLGIRSLDEGGQLEALLVAGNAESQGFWSDVWKLGRIVGTERTIKSIEQHLEAHTIRAMTRSGSFVRIGVLTLPGALVPMDVEANAEHVVDSWFHGEQLAVLEHFGMVSQPLLGRLPRQETWFADYRKEQTQLFLDRPEMNGKKPQQDLLVFDEQPCAGPCEPVRRLTGDSQLDYCMALVAHGNKLAEWTIRHETNQNYGAMRCTNPTLWTVAKYGVVKTSLGPIEAGMAAGPELSKHSAYLPVLDVEPHVARQLGLASSIAEVRGPTMRLGLETAFGLSPAQFGRALELTLETSLKRIDSLPDVATGGRIPIAEIAVVVAADAHSVEAAGCRFGIVSSAEIAERLVTEWGFQGVSELFTVQVAPVGAAERVRATDIFPALASEGVTFDVVTCEQVEVHRSSDAGRVSEHVDSYVHDGIVYVTADADDLATVLDAVTGAADLKLRPDERTNLLAERDRVEANKLRRAAAKAATNEERVLLAVGERALRQGLPKELIDELFDQREDDLSGLEIAELALAVHGVEVLKNHKAELEARGFDIPGHWAGGRKAREFATSLGFPMEFAGFQQATRDSLLKVDGPLTLHDLHDFQRVSANRIRDLLKRGTGRGLLALPTGAGKTRTATHAFIEAMRDGEISGPILWVAQTDELCEQAIESWADNWRAMGPQATLKLGRLWGSNSVENLSDPHQVVVATIAKLQNCFDDSQYSWLAKATAVVIDEAHRSISPAYTRLLEWLGMARNQDRVPLIGLSATPYRGTSEVETERLVARYGKNRLDEVGDEPYVTLQAMKVLSQVEHQLLAGSNVTLSQSELAVLTEQRRLPPEVLARIGEDKDRNQTIIDSINDLPEDTTVLLFAASVVHAELLAGRLSVEGIEARAISASTDRGARRHYISQFRSGEVRVLTNYGVLSEGFDAPAVGAVYLARPTYSPNLYQQMIGRGLRGPLNGGKETCLVVNVEDNIAQYGEQLAFHEFEPLWRAQT